jgi:hypothetical protein
MNGNGPHRELDVAQVTADVQHQRVSATTSVDAAGNTLLACAAATSQFDLVSLLLDHFAGDVSAALHKANVDADTPLHHVCRDNNVAMARVLISRGASVAAENAAGKRPLELCNAEARSILLTGEEYGPEMLAAHGYALWFEMIGANDSHAEVQGVVGKVLNYVSRDASLAVAQDSRGRMAFEAASPLTRPSVHSQLVLHSRYRILDGRPAHASDRYAMRLFPVPLELDISRPFSHLDSVPRPRATETAAWSTGATTWKHWTRTPSSP